MEQRLTFALVVAAATLTLVQGLMPLGVAGQDTDLEALDQGLFLRHDPEAAESGAWLFDTSVDNGVYSIQAGIALWFFSMIAFIAWAVWVGTGTTRWVGGRIAAAVVAPITGVASVLLFQSGASRYFLTLGRRVGTEYMFDAFVPWLGLAAVACAVAAWLVPVVTSMSTARQSTA